MNSYPAGGALPKSIVVPETISLMRPSPGEHTTISGASGKHLHLHFAHERDVSITVSRESVSFVFPDGGRITLSAFSAEESVTETVVLRNGTAVTFATFLELAEVEFVSIDAQDVPENGLENYTDDPGALLDGIDRLGKLGTDYWGDASGMRVWSLGMPDNSEQEGMPDIIIPGTLSISMFMFEDGMPFKYQLAARADPATGPADTTLEEGYDPVTGMPISMDLSAAPGVYVYSITIGELPGAAQGVIFYQGVPVTQGQVIMQPDMSGFSFKPTEYYSGDVNFNLSYVLADPKLGPATVAQNITGVLHIDSVADLPDASSQGTGRTDDGDSITVEAPSFNRGWASQNASDENSLQVTFDVSVEFYDLDGSEIGYIDILLPQGFSAPGGAVPLAAALGGQAAADANVEYETYSNAQGNWVRIPLGDLSLYRGTGGKALIPVTLVMDRSAVFGAKELDIQVVALERDNLDTDGHHTYDNTAVRVIGQAADVDLLAGTLTVQAGWAYEGNKTGGDATGDISSIGLDPASTTGNGAPIIFNLSNGGILDQVVITVPTGSGGLYLGGAALTPTSSGSGSTSYTVTATDLASNALTFKPSGYGDGDVPISYVLTATDSNNNVFTFTGSTTVVVDAVADAGVINTPTTAMVGGDNETFNVTVNATFADVDGSERHYILVEYNNGWTSPDPYDLVIVYFDSNGNALRPVAYDPDGEYDIDISGYAYSIPYFRFDVTAQSVQANGAPTDYVVRVVPPANATDMLLNVATMAEEYPASLDGREYDLANNIAYATDQVLVNVVDSTVLISATGAYENHNPNQYQGSTTTISTDGVITVNLSANGDKYWSESGHDDVVYTFTYDPANPAADPTPGSFYSYQTGLTYSFGNTTSYYSYTQIGPTQYQLVIHAGNIHNGLETIKLRYNPPQDNDTDITEIVCRVPVISGGGQTGILTTDSVDLIVDAVANKPTPVTVEAQWAGGHTAAQSGGAVTVAINVQFGDYADGSEQHYLVFDLSSGFAAINLSSFPPGSALQLTGSQITDAGLNAYTDSNRYIVLQVPNSYLQGTGGLFNAPVQATLDTVTEDTTLNLNFNAVSVDHASDSGEITVNNNYASTPGSGSVAVHTVTSEPVLHATTAFENDIPNAHTGSVSTANGAALISITGIDDSEAVTSLTISWTPELGTLYYNGAAISNGTVNGVTFDYNQAAGTLTLTGAGGVSGAVNGLSYVPRFDYSDQDDALTYSGVITDTASGMTKTFGPAGSSDIATTPVPVVVDAVAQQPTGAAGNIVYPTTTQLWEAAHDQVSISATATFRDTSDGSEKHYLLIEAKSYFVSGSLVGTDGTTLTTVGYNSSGQTLTPNGSGGWLNPSPSSPADQSATAASTKTFFQIPVDDVIAQHTAPVGTAQDIGNFTVTLNVNGSYTVTYNAEIRMNTTGMTADFTDSVATGGMSHETATKTVGDQYSGGEGYLYNNTAYDLMNEDLEVAVVGTSNVSVLTGWATEDDAPRANEGHYPANNGKGAGILAVRTDPGVAGQDYADEQVTLVFTYNSLYRDASTGQWVTPGAITYNGSVATTTVNPATGLVTVTVVINTGDTRSIVESTVANPNPDDSLIRFHPGMIPTGPRAGTYQNNFSDIDVKMGYTATAQDMDSGATSSVGGGALAIVIDAVADKPTIDNVEWQYNPDGAGTSYSAFDDGNVTLQFTAYFPDKAPDGVVTEGHYILIKQNALMDLSADFKAAVATAGFTIDNYVVSGETAPYYRIPAAFFGLNTDPPFTANDNAYNVILPMVMSDPITDGIIDAATVNDNLTIYALAIVEHIDGQEREYGNNTADHTLPVPELAFAVVDSTVNPSRGQAYEQDAPNAYEDDYITKDRPVFSMNLNLAANETAGDVAVTYDHSYGTLQYQDGNGVWQDVASSIPSQYANALRWIAIRQPDGLGDKDQHIGYSVTVTDQASGASRTFTGDMLVVVDAVAQKPDDPTNTAVIYGSGDGQVSYNEDVSFTITANYPDFDKSTDNHSRYYILIQQPGSAWQISYPDMAVNPYDIYIYEGVTYFRVPVNPATFDASGNASVNFILTAPPVGSLLYANSQPIKVYALSVARDPNLDPLLPGDQEIRYTNNWAYSDVDEIPLNYDTDNPTLFTVDPLYENNKPQGNLLGPDGQQVSTTGGGDIHLAHEVDGTPVGYVRITWDPSKGDLVVNGTPVSPGPGGYYDLPAADLDSASFQTNTVNSDVDMGPVNVEFFDGGGTSLGTATYTPIVDAVAQVPTDVSSDTDYGTDSSTGLPYGAATPGDPVTIDVTATFHDLEDHSDRFVVVEYQPGWSLGNGESYPIITGPDGKQYWQVPVDDSQIDPSTGVATVPVTVIPPTTGGTPGSNGESSYNVGTGAMTVRTPTGGSDQEYTSGNNVSYNLTGETDVIISRAESNPVLNVTNTYAGNDPTGSGVNNPGFSSNLYVTGLNQGSDTIPQVVLQFNNTNGDVTYNGNSLNGQSGVNYSVDASGNVTAVISNPAIIAALVSGSAASSAVKYTPSTYIDSDVPVTASFTVQDNFSPDNKTVSNTPTIIVDAVALQPVNVSMNVPGYTGAVGAGVEVPVSVTATFNDLTNNPNATHYMAIEQVGGWDVAGGLPPGVVVETYNGVTYYLISVDLYGNGGSPYLVKNADGSFTFTLPLQSPSTYTSDVQDAVKINGGAVVVQAPRDQEITFDNNTSVVNSQVQIDVGVVQTTEVDFTISPVIEDSDAGAVISLDQAMQNTLNTNNEIVTDTTLTFTGNFTGYAAGEQVATIIYDGQAIPVLSNGDGTASVNIDFGPNGYSPSNNPTLIWGTATVGSGGAVQVSDWNHTGSNMSVSSSSTVVDKASQAETPGVSGSGAVTWTPTADAPTDLVATDPARAVGASSQVTFTVSGEFADVDGSETHYYLVQQLPGWTGNYQTTVVDGVTYFMVPISTSTAANPSVNVTLNTPAGITTDGDYTLIVSGMSVDGASTNTSTVTTSTTVTVGVVNATGVSLTMGGTSEYDGGAAAGVQMNFGWIGTQDNDRIASISITDLQGGAILDQNGNVLFTSAPATLDITKALNGEYYYRPPAYVSGTLTVGFTATAVDNASNAATTFPGQSGTVVVDPVSTVPGDASGATGAPVDEAGHTAQVTVNLSADFRDYTGSEDHFFLVRLPSGAIPPSSWTAVTAGSDAALYNAATGAGWTGVFYKVPAASDGTASFDLTLPENTPAAAVVVQAGSTESSLSPPQYVFSPDTGSVALPATGAINQAPDAVQETETVANINGAQKTGAIPLTDPDGDGVNITSVTINGVPVSQIGGSYSGGVYGSFVFNPSNGGFTYTANGSGSGSDVLAVTVSDGNGGTSTSTITVNVGAARSAFLAMDMHDGDYVAAAGAARLQDEEEAAGRSVGENAPADEAARSAGDILPTEEAVAARAFMASAPVEEAYCLPGFVGEAPDPVLWDIFAAPESGESAQGGVAAAGSPAAPEYGAEPAPLPEGVAGLFALGEIPFQELALSGGDPFEAGLTAWIAPAGEPGFSALPDAAWAVEPVAGPWEDGEALPFVTGMPDADMDALFAPVFSSGAAPGGGPEQALDMAYYEPPLQGGVQDALMLELMRLDIGA